MMGSSYDVTVIGGGPGGYKAAELLGEKGLRVALVEASEIGGTCLNMGCIPFKTYLHASRINRDAALLAGRGILDANPGRLHQAQILKEKDGIVRGLRQSVEAGLRQRGVTLYRGTAEVLGDSDSEFTVRAEGELLKSTRLIIATGSEEKRITVPDGLPYRVITSKEMLELDALPEEVDIIGAGTIGLEAASYYLDAGCRVTLVEAAERIGGHIDGEMAKALARILEKRGATILTETRLERFDADGVAYRNREGEIRRNPDTVLIAVGRRPKVDRNSVERLQLRLDGDGIWIDEMCRTSHENVYACGDVTGKLMLAHTAYRQAKVIADAICGTPCAMDYSLVPRVIYTNPEVLTIGATEEDCVRDGIPYRADALPMTYSGKYFAENGKDGAKAKIIADGEDRLIGLHVIGNGFSEFSMAAELMIANRMKIEEIGRLVFPHPTYAEIFSELTAMRR